MYTKGRDKRQKKFGRERALKTFLTINREPLRDSTK